MKYEVISNHVKNGIFDRKKTENGIFPILEKFTYFT